MFRRIRKPKVILPKLCVCYVITYEAPKHVGASLYFKCMVYF
jgi:hypothetical protein